MTAAAAVTAPAVFNMSRRERSLSSAIRGLPCEESVSSELYHAGPGELKIGIVLLSSFDPLVAEWFSTRLGAPTEPQVQGWPLIRQGEDVLISAPTGSGKTLAAFLVFIDSLFRR